MSSIEDIVDDIWLTIIDKYLDLKSRVQLSRVCKRFHSLVRQSFDGKQSLLLTDDSPLLVGASDENISKYTVLSVKDLCEQRDGLWLRGERGLRLLGALEIEELALKNYKNLKCLCLVVTKKLQTESSPIDVVIKWCGPQLKRLVVINTSVTQLNVTDSQMKLVCDRFPALNHFELFTPYLCASEECFRYLLTHCPRLESFKVRAKQVFGQRISSGANGGHHFHYNSITFTGMSFSSLSVPMSLIDCSSALLSHSTVLSLVVNPFVVNIKHFGVDRVGPELMQSIAHNLKALTTLSIGIDPDLTREQCVKCFEAIGRLNQLKTLRITWLGTHPTTGPQRVFNIDDRILKALKVCHSITRLTLSDAVIDDTSLTAIAKCVPRLKTLQLIDCALCITTFDSIHAIKSLNELLVSHSVLTPNPVVKRFHKPFTAFQVTNECLIDGLIETQANSPQIYGIGENVELEANDEVEGMDLAMDGVLVDFIDELNDYQHIF